MGYVTAQQAADHLQISDDTVRRRAKAGAIPSRVDAAGRLLVDVPGLPDLVSAVVAIAPAGGGLLAGTDGLLAERSAQLVQALAEVAFLRSQVTELTGLLGRALRPARQTRRARQLLTREG